MSFPLGLMGWITTLLHIPDKMYCSTNMYVWYKWRVCTYKVCGCVWGGLDQPPVQRSASGKMWAKLKCSQTCSVLQSCSTMLDGICSWDACCWIYMGGTCKVKGGVKKRYWCNPEHALHSHCRFIFLGCNTLYCFACNALICFVFSARIISAGFIHLHFKKLIS